MQMLSSKPDAAYRRVDLDARIEASSNGELTRICLEEAVSALSQASLALERSANSPPTESIGRAHSIAIWLVRSVSPDNPMRGQLMQFYGGLAATIGSNLVRPDLVQIRQARDDFRDLLDAAQQAPARAA
ncbi:flagellar protein FliS [Erythrobacter sp. F6033]|uniref:flagellar protein FliS n=1 Tax=Erythrobacter sp. F6033 TaxID=2926401 RepID=UPI001FF394CE|nr:flagellar protein FliS [Erythrobacter sp. F6033]MCK0129410.1 flagellar protein FliS [Erythrobacter sp. F6033]